ncbi:hypothetical protein JCM8115_001867 [Rhodotorula mucilaginosa]|nr:hypothetical protein B0A53_05915 [Rhodotorula sp. CCFEE 5036]
MSSPSSQSAPGYLWVFSEPGKSATLEEFQDWYDNEHVPLRMQHIPEFETGARYQAADGFSPGWSAAYDIRSVALFSDPKYTRLRANRSKREGELVARLEVLDRRTAEKLGETSPPPPANEAPAFVLTLAGDERPDGQKDLERFKDVKGWRRSHYHHVYDSLIIGYGRQPESNVAPKYAVIHEFDTEDYLESPVFKEATEGTKEVRRWKLYKATPNTAPADT